MTIPVPNHHMHWTRRWLSVYILLITGAAPVRPVVISQMTDTRPPFERAWFTAGRTDLWNCQATYCTVPYEYLPRLSRVTDDLTWLDQVTPELRRVIGGASTLNSSENQIANLESIVAKAKSLSLPLPEPFQRFMRAADLQDKVPTCTGCYLGLSDDFVPISGAEGQFLLRFLNDSQGCVMWYLRLGRTGSSGVIASTYFLELDIFDAVGYKGVKRQDAFREAVTCAETFTEFLYRFWVENTIWYSLHKQLPLTQIQQEYKSQITTKL